MPTPRHATAVLLFTRTAAAEAEARPLLGRPARDRALAAALIAHTRRQLRGLGRPIWVIDSRSQQGADFGARFSEALARVFAAGYTQVLAMGIDTPAFTRGRIRAALEWLESRDQPVLGRAPDGGLYCIGLPRRFFQPGSFAALPWCTSALGSALQAQLESRRARPTLLAPLPDLDTTAALAAFARRAAGASLRTLAARIAQWLGPGPALPPPVFQRRPLRRGLMPAGMRAPPRLLPV